MLTNTNKRDAFGEGGANADSYGLALGSLSRVVI